MKKVKSVCLCVLAVMIFAAVVYVAEQPTICTDVSKYGHYTGTAANQFVRNYINSFFPAQIEESFSDVRYSYKAAGENTYDFEAYLEFSITDTGAFWRYVEKIAPEGTWETFSFDEAYQIHTIENRLDIQAGSVDEPESELYHPIERAKIRTILYNGETQTIIFWALGVYDGGGVGTNFLNVFFDRFGIDPVIYEQTADSPYGRAPYGID